MNKIYNEITGVAVKTLRFLFLSLFFSLTVLAQSPTNLEKFYTLADSAAGILLNDLNGSEEVYLNLNLGSDYSVLANQIRGRLLKNNIQLLPQNLPSRKSVDFVIDECVVLYGEPRRDGWFGDFYAERTVKLSGNYFVSSDSGIKNFTITDTDIVEVDEVDRLESRSYPFTRGDLPPEPFLPSILEPVVAIGAAAITIILFFSVRSK